MGPFLRAGALAKKPNAHHYLGGGEHLPNLQGTSTKGGSYEIGACRKKKELHSIDNVKEGCHITNRQREGSSQENQ